jgi:two-component system NtrC family sensor kinase
MLIGGKRYNAGIFRDVTERKQAEETLRQSEQRFLLAENVARLGTFDLNVQTGVNVWSPQLEAMYGLPPGGFAGTQHAWEELLHPDDRAEAVARAQRAFETNAPTDGEWRVIWPDGSMHWLFGRFRLLRTESGEPLRLTGVNIDITERKQAEEARREAEEETRTLLEEAPVGIIHTDLKGKITYVNQRFESESGYSRREVIGKGVFQLDWFPAGTLKFLAERMVARLGGSLAKHWETQFKCKDGGWIWIELEGRILARSEVPVGFQVIATNVTERKQAEEALRQSEEKYRTILEKMEDSYFEVDLGGHLTFVNNSVCRDLGYSREELIGMSYKGFTIEEDIESVFRVFNEVYRTGLPNKGFPWKTIRKDGVQGFAETSISLLRNEKGEILGLRGVGRDVTDRRQAEEKLRQSEENYRLLFDSQVIGSVVLDAETMKVVMVNQAALKMFGFSSAGEAFEAKPFDFIPPEDKEKYLDIAKTAVFEQNSHEAHQLKTVTRDGREIWINTTAANIIHKGRVAALISFTDITEQKLQHEKLLITDRLASIGELAAGAAHELNNPLASIIGLSELLMERNTPDYIRKDLAMIRDEARRAANVTSNLLTFARKHRPVKQLTQINDVIEDVLKLRGYAHKSNCIVVERHLASDLPEIPLDHFQMQQVFLNIVINAEYFMMQAHKKGTLTITTKRQNGSVIVSFADDGPGIPPENLTRIFDPFFTTKEVGKGTGLGLSICHGIVAAHGGHIYARSQLGKAATIFIDLPTNASNHVEVML